VAKYHKPKKKKNNPFPKDHLCNGWFYLVHQICKRKLKCAKLTDEQQITSDGNGSCGPWHGELKSGLIDWNLTHLNVTLAAMFFERVDKQMVKFEKVGNLNIL
jgi:hypothetical protein